MKKTLLRLALASLAMSTQLLANPSGPTVVVGDVSFSSSGSYYTITSTTDRSIVDWDDFSIGASDETDIYLPYSSSAILNRVTSSNVSNLLGTLTCNGMVYVINENGIVIGPDGGMITNGFLASALDVLDSDFLTGTNLYFYTEQNNSVINYGTIYSTGDVILIAPFVQNSGEILAIDSAVAMGAGTDILYQPYYPYYDANKITVFPGGTTNQAGTGVINAGDITAIEIELKADGNPYALAINCQGWVNAVGAGESDGRVVLLSQANTLTEGAEIYMNALVTTSGAAGNGGDVLIVGNSMTLDNATFIDCSAPLNGGNILIGGSLQNADPTVPTGQEVIVIDGAFFNVSSTYFGSGGTCVFWANDTVTFDGYVQATGGAFTGDGGIVEVCGLNSIDFTGAVDVSSSTGSDGLLISCP